MNEIKNIKPLVELIKEVKEIMDNSAKKQWLEQKESIELLMKITDRQQECIIRICHTLLEIIEVLKKQHEE